MKHSQLAAQGARLMGILLAAGMAIPDARATCGASFCMVNTTWGVQGATTEPGLRLDLRYEYIDQDQPRSGSNKVAVGQIPQHHDEVRTINRNLLATVDYAYDSQWGYTVTLPVIDRDHTHIHNHRGEQLLETWNFTRIGDMRVLGRRQWLSESRDQQRLDFYGLTFGLKLPTGDTNVRNAENEPAERSLQPGTGTVDALVGGYFTRALGSGSSWFADVLLQQPLDSNDHYKPGTRVSLDVGYRYAASEQVSLMLQLNALYRGRDRGLEAEPASSGGRFLYISPGVSMAVSRNVQIYAFAQLPLYQYVNGVQLTADWAAVVGIGTRF